MTLVKRKAVVHYTIFGVIFGLLFPVFAIVIILVIQPQPLTWTTLVDIQVHTPLLWMIDTAPLFLGLFALLAGIRQDQVNLLNEDLDQQIRAKNRLLLDHEIFRRTLEHKVTQQVEKMRAAAQVAREAAAIFDLQQLLDETVQLISSQFGFYHAGIFLIDPTGKYAHLKAANSEGGQKMLARDHKLEVGQVGIVGHVARTAHPRIALDVGADAVFFQNPDLPDTRSEMALPLVIHDQVIGVLDVQSTESSAFSQEDIENLQLMADQIALAIEKARLLEQSKTTLQEIKRLYQDSSATSWREQTQREITGYAFSSGGVRPLHREEADPDPKPGGEISSSKSIEIPLMVRNQTVGTIVLNRGQDQQAWSVDDQALVRDIATQVASALENARLLAEIQQRVIQEQMVGQMTAQMQSSLDLDAVIQTAVREIGLAFPVSQVQIRLGNGHLEGT